MNVLTNKRVSVNAEHDTVVLAIDGEGVAFGYSTALRISQALRVAGNHALLAAKVARPERVETHAFSYNVALELPAKAARNVTRPSGMSWEVKVDGELVVLVIGNFEASFEGDTAITIGAWMRLRARAAKRWSGDHSRTLTMTGLLSDAEENYKLGRA